MYIVIQVRFTACKGCDIAHANFDAHDAPDAQGRGNEGNKETTRNDEPEKTMETISSER